MPGKTESKPYSAPGYGTASNPSPPSYSSGKKTSDSRKGSDDIYNYSASSGESGPIYGGESFFRTQAGVRFLSLSFIYISCVIYFKTNRENTYVFLFSPSPPLSLSLSLSCIFYSAYHLGLPSNCSCGNVFGKKVCLRVCLCI